MMIDKPKVSIIVPIHNAGQFLSKCLYSLVNQTLTDIEIILILDCPTDNSDKIAEEFAQRDTRIKILRNEVNLHTGESRNKGIEIAKGEYIGFHDHDDYSSLNMYELLYAKATAEQFDVVRCSFNCVYTDVLPHKVEQYIYPPMGSDKEQMYEFVAGDRISCVIWNHIYKADFLRQHEIKFLDSREVCSEDSIYFFEVYNKTNKIGTIPECLYDHVFHSSNTGKVYDYRSIQNRIIFFERLYTLLLSNGINESQAKNMLQENIIRSFYTASRQAFLLLPIKRSIAEIQLVRKNRLVMECIHNLYKKENRKLLWHLKPTVILFSFCLKLADR